MEDFFEKLNTQDANFLRPYAELIREKDSGLEVKVQPVMSVALGLNFLQEGVMKYALTRTQQHFSFHTMVMYAFPEVKALTENLLEGTKAKIQKGCINFRNTEELPINIFNEIIDISVQQPFETVVAHYQRNKK